MFPHKHKNNRCLKSPSLESRNVRVMNSITAAIKNTKRSSLWYLYQHKYVKTFLYLHYCLSNSTYRGIKTQRIPYLFLSVKLISYT